jgi:hypothetical protein
MKIRIQRPIKELLALLPDGTLRPDDLTFLTHTRGYIHALRDYDVTDAAIFTNEVRRALALEVTGVVADILEARLPRAPRGRPPGTRAPGRPAAPLKNQIAAFRDALALMTLIVDEGWHVDPDERAYAQPRAALDSAYTSLAKAAQALGLDIDPLMDMMQRLRSSLDICATYVYTEKPMSIAKYGVVAQINFVLKTLQREATSSQPG